MKVITAPWLQGPAQTVCNMLTQSGHQAWFVGGCVRNALLDAPVSDLDLSTNAHPKVVMQLAADAGLNAVPTGIDHGTVTVIADGIPFEITTFRKDVATDGRRAVVAFADTMAEDARRRDFTINALYCGADGAVVDPLGGLPDLDARRIRFIDDPAQRIKEDYLRILRFFRFTAWYGTDGFDADGLAACAMHADGIDGLSSERVTTEMLKLLAAPDPAPAIAAMGQSGVLWHVIPGAAPDVLTVLVHLEGEAGLNPDPQRRLIALGGMRDRLRLSNAQAKHIDAVLADMPLSEIAYRHGATAAIDRYLITQASLSQPLDETQIPLLETASKQIFPLKAADFMPALKGPELGQALRHAQARWIASGFALTKDQLLD